MLSLHFSHSSQAFSADIILVIGQDKLHSALVQALQGQGRTVVKLQKSGGVVMRVRGVCCVCIVAICVLIVMTVC